METTPPSLPSWRSKELQERARAPAHRDVQEPTDEEKDLALALQMSVEDAANYKASQREMSQMQPRVDVGQQGRVVTDTSLIHVQSKSRVDVGQQGRVVRDTSQIHSQSKPRVDVGQQGRVVRDTSQIRVQSKSIVDVGQQGCIVRDTSQIHSQSKPKVDVGQQGRVVSQIRVQSKSRVDVGQQGRVVRDTSQIQSQSKARAPAHTDLSAKAKEDKKVGVAHVLGKSEALEGLAGRYGLIED